MTGYRGRFATPTEQAHGVLGGPIAKGSDQERSAAARRVRLESRSPQEALAILQMLGLDAPGGAS